MEKFRENFSVYSYVLSFTALCPYDESLLGKTRRVIVVLLILCLLAIQVSTLRLVEISLYNVVMMFSFTCPMTLYFLRYVGFTVNRPLMKVLFDGLTNGYSTMKDPVELDIFERQIIVAKRVIIAYLGLSSILIAYMTAVVLIPTILRSKLQLQYLHIFGFFFPEMNLQTDWVSILFILVNVLGLLSLASTESALAVGSAYLCGLLEVASYRLEIAIDHIVQSSSSDLIQVESAVELHKRALNLIDYIMTNMAISYLSAIIVAIVSFAVNLYRVSITDKVFATELTYGKDFSNLFFSFNDVLLHFLIIFLGNFTGQRVKKSSTCVFDKISNSLWYCIPLRSQKILLFILLRSVNEARCMLGGLYDVSYEGFSMMMSTSFSYFTVLYSTQ